MQFLPCCSCLLLELGLPKQERSGMPPGSQFGGHQSPVRAPKPSFINRTRDKDKSQHEVLCNGTQAVSPQISIPSTLRERAAWAEYNTRYLETNVSASILGLSDIQLLNVCEICFSVPDPEGKRNQKTSRWPSSLIQHRLLVLEISGNAGWKLELKLHKNELRDR